MPDTVILGSLAIAAAIPLTWLSLSSGSFRDRGGTASMTDLHQMVLAQSALHRVIRPLTESLAARVRALTPKAWVERLERRITLAGARAQWPVERILAAKVVLAVVPAGAAIAVLRPQEVRVWIVIGIVVVIGYFIPDATLDNAARNRQLILQRRLPDALDQLTMSVEAGLGFEAALGRAGRSGDGPLAEEFIRTLQEMQLGLPRHEALKALARRTDVSDLRTFVFAVNQAETYGIPIADILRLQASELRNKRHMRAEEAALKIPVKIIFPLAFCVFPTLFIVLLGPAAMRIFDAL